MVRKTETDLDRREREAQTRLQEAESKMKAAEQALLEAKQAHAIAATAVVGIQYEKNDIARAVDERAAAVRRQKLADQAKAEELEQFDARVASREQELIEQQERGNVAGVAALRETIASMKSHRPTLAVA